jgi:hypothetical protein
MNLVAINEDLYSAVFREMKEVPFTLERMSSCFKLPNLNEDQKETLRSIGVTPVVEKPSVYHGIVEIENIKEVLSLKPQECPFVAGSFPLNCYLAHVNCLKAVALFTQGSTCAAYGIGNYLANPDTSMTLIDNQAVELYPEGQSVLRKFKMGKVSEMRNTLITSKLQMLLYSPDTTKKISANIADPTTDFNCNDGRFFPYFSGMVLPDKDFIEPIFRRLFFHCLGNNFEEASAAWNVLRQGLRVYAATPQGRAMSHIFKGIELAVEAQSELSVVISNGVYRGFILEGKFKIYFQNLHYEPQESEELIKEIKLADQHGLAVKKICGLFNSAVKGDGSAYYAFRPEDFSTSRLFVRSYNSIDLGLFTSTTFEADLTKYVGELLYTDTFKIPNYDMVMDFLRYVNSGEDVHLQQYPAYLQGGHYKRKSRVEIGLGIFGGKAPSISYGQGTDMCFMIPASSSVEDPLLKTNDEGKRPLQYLPASIEPLGTAITQWNSVFDTGAIRLPNPRKGKTEFTNGKRVALKFAGVPQFDNVYRLVKERRVGNAISGGGKRSREEGGSGDPKAKRVKASSGPNLMDLF